MVRLLGTLDGQPQWVVTDGGGAVVNGVRKAWPDAEKWRCAWHLQRNLADKFPSVVQQDLTDPLHGKLKHAQLSEENWDAYRTLLRTRAAANVGYAAAENAAVKFDGLIRT
ncbi:transposase [Nocardioides okcheonensis]|uniref:transposase n=1 Tax=Nocardioides okcheonensis TaxID=2894081 RepID=UPI001E44A0F8|nr:transposase [Nocardioides okcheonensis]UFN45112.1 transposase [Nocardioides okcheonensis]